MVQQYQTAVIVVTPGEKIIPAFKRIEHVRDGLTHEETGCVASGFVLCF